MTKVHTSHAVKDVDDAGVTRRTECGIDWAGDSVQVLDGHRGRDTWKWIEWRNEFGTSEPMTLRAKNGRRIQAQLCRDCENALLDENVI